LTFSHARVSRYDIGLPALDEPDNQHFEQLKFNPPNLPMFNQGTVPFIGDYIDIAGQMFVPRSGAACANFPTSAGVCWRYNNPAPGANAANAAIHYAAWTSNQDVIPPPAGHSWAEYSA